MTQEAKMYVNNREFWYKQTRKEEQSFCHPFSACTLHKQIIQPTFGANTFLSGLNI